MFFRRFVILFFSFYSISIAQAQDSLQVKSDQDTSIVRKKIEQDSLVSNSFISPTLSNDSLQRRYPTTPGDIETTILYKAKDSIFFNLKNQKLNLYGETNIVYDDIILDAAQVDVDMSLNTMKAIYREDTTGKQIGKPVFSQSGETYIANQLVYNFKTRRAQIKGVVTEQNNAFMHGGDVRKNEEDEMFIKNALYTTCNLEHPHFYIASQKIKAIPRNKVVSGPFNMRFGEVITPLWFPFGMFPQPKSKASGIVFPSYGEENRRGFFLRNGGYYFALSDYIDLKILGDIYSKGGSAINVTSNYKVRYKYSGALNFSYVNNVSDNLENPLNTRDFWVRWSHRPESKGTGNFNASVNAGTSTYNTNTNLVNQDFNRSINSSFSSNVAYSKRFQGTPFNMNISARHNQNLQTGLINLSLPELTLSMNRIHPLKKIIDNQKSPLAKLNFSHNFTAKNEFSNTIIRTGPGFTPVNLGGNLSDTLDFTIKNLSSLYDRAKTGGRHTIPVSTSFTLLKFLTVSPNFNYNEVWYTRELDFTYVDSLQGVRIDTLNTFSRAGSWQSGISASTILYGTVFFKKDGFIRAIRHVMTPSVSFNYNPDFGTTSRGIYEEVQIDSLGNTRRLSKYEGFVFGSPSGAKSQSLGLSLQNNIEMKVRDKKDTTGLGYKKVKLFDNFSLSSGYNFAADAFKLSNVSFSTRTSFFKNKLGININGSIDPYQYELLSKTERTDGSIVINQSRIDRYKWQDGQGVGQLSNLTTAVSLNLSPNRRGSGINTSNRTPNTNSQEIFTNPDFQNDNALPGEIEHIQQFSDQYVDFSIPWSLNMNYSISRSKVGFQEARIIQSLNFSGDVSITPKTKVNFRSGYDLEKKEFTQTSLSVNRDLHCWSLSFSWVPFGRFQQFGLIIQPKSQLLQDLKLERRRSFLDYFNN